MFLEEDNIKSKLCKYIFFCLVSINKESKNYIVYLIAM